MKLDKFTIKTQEALSLAQQSAADHNHQQIEITHLLHAFLEDQSGVLPPLLEKSGVNVRSVQEELKRLLEKAPRVTGAQGEYLSPALNRLFADAEKISKEFKDDFISAEHILLAVLERSEEPSVRVLKNFGADKSKILTALQQIRGGARVTDQNPESKYQVLEKFTVDLTAKAKEGKLDPVIGRDEEIRRVIQVLSRRTKNNPVLIGEPGVGKTAIVEGLAQRVVKGDVPEGLKNKKILSLDLGALVAGAKFRGEFEDRLKSLIKEVTGHAGEIVLFIDELHTLVGAGAADGAMDASNLLKPALARGELHCVGATTLDEYRKHIEKDAALERRFQQVFVGQPSVEDTIAILRGLKERYELHHGVRIQDAAIVAAATLSDRYISERFLPDKAIDLIDEAASRMRIEIDSMPVEIDTIERKIIQLEIEKQALKREKDPASQERLKGVEGELEKLKSESAELKDIWKSEKAVIVQVKSIKEEIEKTRLAAEEAERASDYNKAAELKYGRLHELNKKLEEIEYKNKENKGKKRLLNEEVTEDDIASIVAKWTGIPVSKLMEGEAEKLLHMEKILQQSVVGQNEALTKISHAVRRSRAGLKDQNRPIGSFLFLGPTGVGKTETAKALSEFLFDTRDALIRIDMSEFMEKHSVARLIGAPPGYVGYDEGGYLTEAIRRRPYSVVLLDEIEKAHPDVFNILLQILDDGRLTDGQGRTVDFKNCVVIMTSNLGSAYLLEEGDEKSKEDRVWEMLKSTLKPEFINRIDDIVMFKPLGQKQIREIVTIQLQNLTNMLQNKKITIKVKDDVKDYLGKLGYDPVFGARPLKRLIQNRIQNLLAEKLLSGEIHDGSEIVLKMNNDEICFE